MERVLLAKADSGGYGTAYTHLSPEVREAMHAACESRYPSRLVNQEGEVDLDDVAALVQR